MFIQCLHLAVSPSYVNNRTLARNTGQPGVGILKREIFRKKIIEKTLSTKKKIRFKKKRKKIRPWPRKKERKHDLD